MLESKNIFESNKDSWAEEAEVSDIFKRTETLCKILDIEISVIILSSHLSFEH